MKQSAFPLSLSAACCAAFLILADPSVTSAAESKSPSGDAVGTVYYLKQAVSVTTDSGITSALPGTKVTKVAAAPGGMKVKLSDGTTLTVTMKQVTTDRQEAEELARQENAKKEASAAQVAAAQAAQAAEDAAAKQKAQALAQQYGQTGAGGTAPPAQTTTPSGPSGLTGSVLDDKGSGTAVVHHPKPKPALKGKKR